MDSETSEPRLNLIFDRMFHTVPPFFTAQLSLISGEPMAPQHRPRAAIAVVVCNNTFARDGADRVGHPASTAVHSAVLLACSLSAVGSALPRIALTHGLEPWVERRLQQAGFQLIDVPTARVPTLRAMGIRCRPATCCAGRVPTSRCTCNRATTGDARR